MRLLFSIVMLSMITLTSSIHAQSNESDPALLIGRSNVKWLQNNKQFAWFNSGYDNYNTNASAIEQLQKITPDISFIVFAGTWSDATQTLLPQFYKALDAAKINRGRVMLYFLDRDKKSPQGFEGQFSINNVPTFIVMKNGEEVGRIVESVSSSIEGDLVDILGR